jgi:hypothetical protein
MCSIFSFVRRGSIRFSGNPCFSTQAFEVAAVGNELNVEMRVGARMPLKRFGDLYQPARLCQVESARRKKKARWDMTFSSKFSQFESAVGVWIGTRTGKFKK